MGMSYNTLNGNLGGIIGQLGIHNNRARKKEEKNVISAVMAYLISWKSCENFWFQYKVKDLKEQGYMKQK